MKLRDAWNFAAILMILAGASFLLGQSVGVVLLIVGVMMVIISFFTWI